MPSRPGNLDENHSTILSRRGVDLGRLNEIGRSYDELQRAVLSRLSAAVVSRQISIETFTPGASTRPDSMLKAFEEAMVLAGSSDGKASIDEAIQMDWISQTTLRIRLLRHDEDVICLDDAPDLLGLTSEEKALIKTYKELVAEIRRLDGGYADPSEFNRIAQNIRGQLQAVQELIT